MLTDETRHDRLVAAAAAVVVVVASFELVLRPLLGWWGAVRLTTCVERSVSLGRFDFWVSLLRSVIRYAGGSTICWCWFVIESSDPGRESFNTVSNIVFAD